MPYNNPIAGGDNLIRPALQSPNYSPGVSGWIVRRDGSVEFNNAVFRGSVFVQSGTDTIVIDNNTFGFPSIAFYTAPNTYPSGTPAGINAYNGGIAGVDTVAVLIQSGADNTGKSMFIAVDTSGLDAGFGNTPGDGSYLRLEHRDDLSSYDATLASDRSLNSGVTNELILSQGDGARLNLGAGTFQFTHQDVLNWPARVIDGKTIQTGGPVDTTSASTTQVAVSSANAINVPVVANHVYIALVQIRVTSTIAADRAEYTLWDGTVGSSNQLGGNVLKKINPTTGQQEDVMMMFSWLQGSTTTLSNVNLAVARFTGTGTITTRVDNKSYQLVIIDAARTGIISNL